jgi:hypothetical protein
MRPQHTSHHVVTCPPGSRSIKKTIHSHSIDTVRPHLSNGVMSTVHLKRVQNAIHCGAVVAEVCAAGPNEVLGRYPPEVNYEKNLHRAHRCVLTQLWLKHCFKLKTILWGGLMTTSARSAVPPPHRAPFVRVYSLPNFTYCHGLVD